MNNTHSPANRMGKTTLLAGLAIAALTSAGSVQAKTINVEAGPLISKFFAEIRCQRAAVKSKGKWTGRYWLKPGSIDGYCQVVVPDPVVKRLPPPKPRPPQGKIISVDAGTLWNKNHADWYCPQLAKKKGGTWTGKWSNKTKTAPSYCQVQLKPVVKVAPPKPTYRTIKVKAGRIWNQAHANHECVKLAKQHKGTWTKRWSSVGTNSSCEVKVLVAAPAPAPIRAAIKPEIKKPRHHQRNIREVSAGRIWDQSNATRKCGRIAEQTNGKWTGKWRHTNANKEAVCEIKYKPLRRVRAAQTSVTPVQSKNVREVSSGRIWDQSQANTKCPLFAAQNKGSWTGKWRHVSANKDAVCEVAFGTAKQLPVVTAAPTTYVDLTPAPAARTREIFAGPIWDGAQARNKCALIAANNKGTWTGKWRKTGPNHNSLCEVRF